MTRSFLNASERKKIDEIVNVRSIQQTTSDREPVARRFWRGVTRTKAVIVPSGIACLVHQCIIARSGLFLMFAYGIAYDKTTDDKQQIGSA